MVEGVYVLVALRPSTETFGETVVEAVQESVDAKLVETLNVGV